MSIVPVILALFGAAAVAGGSGKSAKRVKRINVKDIKFLTSLTPSYEKFMDPIFLCHGVYEKNSSGGWSKDPRKPYEFRDDWNNTNGNRWGGFNHLSYLSNVPYNAGARIAAMRSVINDRRKRSSVESSGTIGAYVRASEAALIKTARGLFSQYKNVIERASDASKIASSLGVDTASVVSEAKGALGDFNVPGVQAISKVVQKWGPIAQTAVEMTTLAMESGNDSGVSGRVIASGLRALAGIAQTIPVVGQVFGMVMSLVATSIESSEDAWYNDCYKLNDKIRKIYMRGIELEFPMPWHTEEMFKLLCTPKGKVGAYGEYHSSLSQDAVARTYNRALETWKHGVPADLLFFVQQWWRLAVTYMSDPRVSDVFVGLGWDNYGGLLASDEQVMLVAAPIAVANGLDVDDFARRLWDRSGGFNTASHGLLTPKQARAQGLKIGTNSWVALDCSPKSTVCQCNTAMNAWWIQWGVLSAEALKLAREMRPLRVKLNRLSS